MVNAYLLHVDGGDVVDQEREDLPLVWRLLFVGLAQPLLGSIILHARPSSGTVRSFPFRHKAPCFYVHFAEGLDWDLHRFRLPPKYDQFRDWLLHHGPALSNAANLPAQSRRFPGLFHRWLHGHI